MTEAGLGGQKDRLAIRDRLSYRNSSPAVENQPLNQSSPNQYGVQSRASSFSQSAIPLRRNYPTNAQHLAAASPTTIQPGSRRYPNFSTPGIRGSIERIPADQASEVMSSPLDDGQSRGLAPSRSAAQLQQLRTRTNSLGTRRIGIRPRQVTTTAGSGGILRDGRD
jgi:hypothetical protein